MLSWFLILLLSVAVCNVLRYLDTTEFRVWDEVGGLRSIAFLIQSPEGPRIELVQGQIRCTTDPKSSAWMVPVGKVDSLPTCKRDDLGICFGYLRLSVAALPLLPRFGVSLPSMRALFLGTGAGAYPQLLHTLYPAAHLTTVDIDAKMIEMAKQFMGLRIPVTIADAREFIQRSDLEPFDLILADTFTATNSDDPMTEDFILGVAARLAPRGIAMFNIINDLGGLRIIYDDSAAMRRLKLLHTAFRGPCRVVGLWIAAENNEVPERGGQFVAFCQMHQKAEKAQDSEAECEGGECERKGRRRRQRKEENKDNEWLHICEVPLSEWVEVAEHWGNEMEIPFMLENQVKYGGTNLPDMDESHKHLMC